MLVDWNLSSSCYLHLTQPVLLYPCNYCKTVCLDFVYVCLQLCLVWSVVFILWYRTCSIFTSDGLFWFFTSFESLNCQSDITSQVPVCYLVSVLPESGHKLVVVGFSKVNMLFAVSNLQILSWSKFSKSAVQPFDLSVQLLQIIC